jgi:flagellin-like protein
MRVQRGITGLETAIILIALVIVASVFAFTIVSVGVFSAQKSQETAYAGFEETRGTLHPNGSIVVKTGTVASTTGAVQVIFTMTLAVDGTPVDLTPTYTVNDTGTDPDASGLKAPTVISFTTASKHVAAAEWTVSFKGDNDGDYLLEKNETAEITFWLHQKQSDGTYALGTATNDFLATRLTAGGTVAVEASPGTGSTFKLDRKLPAGLEAVMSLN